MCNAFNHPPGCTCGWGGDGHLGKRSDIFFPAKVSFFKINELESYINPNAKCPACGAPVFFYKSENGGRVYFDSLGPPWPKHPCTDNTNYYYYDPLSFNVQNLSVTSWQKNKLLPVIVNRNISKSTYAFYLERIGSQSIRRLDFMLFGALSVILLKKDFLAFIKRNGKSSFTLSIYDTIENIIDEINISHNKTGLDNFFQ